jgi:hypothetical protein
MNFNQEISDFQRFGSYTYVLDEVGNVVVNSGSAVFSYNYLALPLQTMVYDNANIIKYYTPTFSEFTPISTTPETIVQNNGTDTVLQEENIALRSQVDDLIRKSETDSSVAESQAVKRIIIDLRIALKQGKEDRDFSVTFPYTPNNKQQ